MTAQLDTPLPCPFCLDGGTPLAAACQAGPDELVWHRVHCDDCGCTLAEEPTAAEALAKWNRRAPVKGGS